MMGHQNRQMAMLFVDIESLIPETHLLRKIERMVSFDFIYDLLAPYYPATGRPSVDPVSMFKMLLIGYLYGIKSERRVVGGGLGFGGFWGGIRAAVGGGSSAQHRLPMVLRI